MKEGLVQKFGQHRKSINIDFKYGFLTTLKTSGFIAGVARTGKPSLTNAFRGLTKTPM